MWLLKSKQKQAKCKFSAATCKSLEYNSSSYNILSWGSLIIDILWHEKLEVLKEVTDFPS